MDDTDSSGPRRTPPMFDDAGLPTEGSAPPETGLSPDRGASMEGVAAVEPEPALDIGARQQPAERASWIAPLALGLIGAVFGAAIVLAALLGGALPGFGTGAGSQSDLAPRLTALEQDAASARDSVSSVANRLAAVETAARQAGGTATDAVNLAQEAKTEAKTATDAAKSAAEHPAQPVGPATPDLQAPLAALADRVAKIEARPEAAAARDVAGLSDRLKGVDGTLGQLQSRLDNAADQVPALTDRLARVEQDIQSALAGRTAASVVALDSLDGAVREGRPFADDLAAAGRLGESEALAALQPLAATGTASVSRLVRDFAAVSPDIRKVLTPAPERPAAEAGVLDRLGFSFTRVVQVRRTDEAEVAPTRPVDEVEAALAQGDVAGAVAAFDRLSDAAKAPGAGWVAEARARLQAEATVAGLRSRALATIASTPAER